MSWLWLLPAAATLVAVGVLTVALRRVAHEAERLHRSLERWDRLAVAVDDLTHEAHAVERDLRRIAHR